MSKFFDFIENYQSGGFGFLLGILISNFFIPMGIISSIIGISIVIVLLLNRFNNINKGYKIQ